MVHYWEGGVTHWLAGLKAHTGGSRNQRQMVSIPLFSDAAKMLHDYCLQKPDRWKMQGLMCYLPYAVAAQ